MKKINILEYQKNDVQLKLTLKYDNYSIWGFFQNGSGQREYIDDPNVSWGKRGASINNFTIIRFLKAQGVL